MLSMTSTHQREVYKLFEENYRTLLSWQPGLKKKKKKGKEKRTDNQ